MLDTDLKQKVLSGLRWRAGLRFLGQLITWSITIFVMRLLSPQDYGLMEMAGVLIAFLTMVNELGLGAVLIQRRDIDECIMRQIFGLLLIINSGLFFLSLLAAPLAADFFKEQRLIPVIRLLSVQFVMASFVIIPQSLIDREMLFKKKSIVELVSAIAGSLATLPLALSGWGVWSLVWGTLTLNLFRTVGLNLVRPYLKLPHFSFKGIGQAISFGGYVTIARILRFFYSQTDIIIVGKFLGRQLLGFYSVALTLASLPMEKISGIINQVAFPAFASIQTDTQKVASHFLKSVRIMSLLAFPVLWGISSIAPEFVNLLLGKKWSIAVVPLQILSLVIPIRMVSNLMSPPLLGLGRADTNFLNVITASLALPVGFLVGCHWGIIGVSIAWSTIFPIVFISNLSRTARVLKITVGDVIREMVSPVVAASAMYISVSIIKLFIPEFDYMVSLTSSVVVGVVVYGAMVSTLDKDGCLEALGMMRIQS